jgi:hypothetical protein
MAMMMTAELNSKLGIKTPTKDDADEVDDLLSGVNPAFGHKAGGNIDMGRTKSQKERDDMSAASMSAMPPQKVSRDSPEPRLKAKSVASPAKKLPSGAGAGIRMMLPGEKRERGPSLGAPAPVGSLERHPSGSDIGPPAGPPPPLEEPGTFLPSFLGNPPSYLPSFLDNLPPLPIFLSSFLP